MLALRRRCRRAAQAETLTIQVTSVVVKVTSIDTKPKGTSKGDRVVHRNSSLNAVRQFGKATGAHVGSDQGTVTFTSAHTERFDGVARAPRRHAPGQGRRAALTSGGLRIPVVGGTGRYASRTGR